MFSRRKHEVANSREWDDVSAWLSDVVEAVEPPPQPAPIDLTRGPGLKDHPGSTAALIRAATSAAAVSLSYF